MKLEAKHLSAYLPYRLNMKRNGFIGILKQIKLPDGESLNEICEFQVSCSNWWENTDDQNHYKPILRPLSDLDKLDGDFATSHSICKMLGNGEDYGNVTIYHFNGEVTIETETDSGTVGYVSLDFSTTQLIREELIKSHYDIFGLIEAGLAIDINTLDN